MLPRDVTPYDARRYFAFTVAKRINSAAAAWLAFVVVRLADDVMCAYVVPEYRNDGKKNKNKKVYNVCRFRHIEMDVRTELA